MNKPNRLFLIAALGLGLAGCGDGQKATGGTADGEILPGSTSDAMLPLDSVRSQAPLAPRSDKPKAEQEMSNPNEPGDVTQGAETGAAADEPALEPSAPAPDQ